MQCIVFGWSENIDIFIKHVLGKCVLRSFDHCKPKAGKLSLNIGYQCKVSALFMWYTQYGIFKWFQNGIQADLESLRHIVVSNK